MAEVVKPDPPSDAPVLPVDLQPDRIKAITDEFSTTIVTFENRNEQRFCNQEDPTQRFSLTWYFLKNEVDPDLYLNSLLMRLRDFFRARKGAYEAWYIYNHHENVYIKVRFSEDKLKRSYFNIKYGSVETEVLQC